MVIETVDHYKNNELIFSSYVKKYEISTKMCENVDKLITFDADKYHFLSLLLRLFVLSLV